MLAIAIAKRLDADIDGLDYRVGAGGNMFIGHMPTTPDTAVAVMPSGGRSQRTRNAIALPSIQFIVRGTDPKTSHDLAETIRIALDCLDMVTLDPGGPDEIYVHGFTAAQSAPLPMGLDETRRYEWSVNIDASTYAPSPNRSAA